MSFLALIVGVLCLLSSASAYWELCHPGAYCGPTQNLISQVGTYNTPDDCGTQCLTLGSTYTFFSYVPSSKQCLCTKTCDSQIANSGVDSYCLNIDWKLCYAGQYCNDPSLTVQVGTYGTEQACADQCWWTNSKFNFFNLVTATQQCQCLENCATLITTSGVNAYSLNGHDCSSNIKKLRRV